MSGVGFLPKDEKVVAFVQPLDLSPEKRRRGRDGPAQRWNPRPQYRGDREFSGIPWLLRHLGFRLDQLRRKHGRDRGTEQSIHDAVKGALQSSPCVSARHHPDTARILREGECDSAARGRPPLVPIVRAPMKMLHSEGLADRSVGTCCEALSPETLTTIPAGGEVQRFPIRRPVRPILSL